jgi:hypothetical protein
MIRKRNIVRHEKYWDRFLNLISEILRAWVFQWMKKPGQLKVRTFDWLKSRSRGLIDVKNDSMLANDSSSSLHQCSYNRKENASNPSYNLSELIECKRPQISLPLSDWYDNIKLISTLFNMIDRKSIWCVYGGRRSVPNDESIYADLNFEVCVMGDTHDNSNVRCCKSPLWYPTHVSKHGRSPRIWRRTL